MADYICPQCSQETETGELLEAEMVDNQFVFYHEACWGFKQTRQIEKVAKRLLDSCVGIEAAAQNLQKNWVTRK